MSQCRYRTLLHWDMGMEVKSGNGHNLGSSTGLMKDGSK